MGEELCFKCQKDTNYPLYLHCNHLICLKCGDSLKNTDKNRNFREKYHIQCPQCNYVTKTNDILNLLNDKDLNSDNKKNDNNNQNDQQIDFENENEEGQIDSNDLQDNLTVQKQQNQNIKQQQQQQQYSQQQYLQYQKQQQINKIQDNQRFYYDSPDKSQQEFQMKNNLSPFETNKQTIGSSNDVPVSQFQNNTIIQQQQINNNNSSTKQNNVLDQKSNMISQSQVQRDIIGDNNKQLSIDNTNTVQKQKIITSAKKEKGRSSRSTTIQQKIISNNINNSNNKTNNINRVNYNNQVYAQNMNLQQTIQDQKKFQQNQINQQNQMNQILKQNNIELQNSQPFQNDDVPLKCKDHDDFISLYCQDCQTINCTSCIYIDNKHKNNCQLIPIKNALSTIKSENKIFKMEIENKLLTIDQSIKICTSNKYLLDIGYYNLQEKITAEFSDLIKQIKQREIEMKNQVNLQFQEKMKEFTKQISDLNYLKQTMQDYQQYDIKSQNSNINNFSQESQDNNNQQQNQINSLHSIKNLGNQQNKTLYVYSIYQIIKQTLKNIDFNFKQYDIQDINILNFQKPVKEEIQLLLQNFGQINKIKCQQQQKNEDQIQQHELNPKFNSRITSPHQKSYSKKKDSYNSKSKSPNKNYYQNYSFSKKKSSQHQKSISTIYGSSTTRRKTPSPVKQNQNSILVINSGNKSNRSMGRQGSVQKKRSQTSYNLPIAPPRQKSNRKKQFQNYKKVIQQQVNEQNPYQQLQQQQQQNQDFYNQLNNNSIEGHSNSNIKLSNFVNFTEYQNHKMQQQQQFLQQQQQQQQQQLVNNQSFSQNSQNVSNQKNNSPRYLQQQKYQKLLDEKYNSQNSQKKNLSNKKKN